MNSVTHILNVRYYIGGFLVVVYSVVIHLYVYTCKACFHSESMDSPVCSVLAVLCIFSVSGVLAPAPCGTLNEICGADQYCDAGLSCQHCSGICRTGIHHSEKLDYACNKYCPGK